jgi:hypothetical protein
MERLTEIERKMPQSYRTPIRPSEEIKVSKSCPCGNHHHQQIEKKEKGENQTLWNILLVKKKCATKKQRLTANRI